MPDPAAHTDPTHLPDGHPPVRTGRTGILLVNLGTPQGTDAASVRRDLKEFRSDRRVVDYPAFLWQPILRGIILNVRPKKTGAAYAKIWRTESDESPLRYYTRQQAEMIAARMGNDRVMVDWAMRYGVPSIESRLTALKDAGCERIVVFPLYPQYSATTTATVNDEVFRVLKGLNWQPAIRTVPPFHDHAGYIDALAASLAPTLEQKPDRVILSYHGLPERYFREGDPYHCHCQKTSRLLREKLGWDKDFAPIAFQSQFGPEKWLGPSTESLVVKAAEDGCKHIAIITPGFVADCIETLEEVGIGLAETFEEHGGETLTAVPCLNDSASMIGVLDDILRTETAGWV